MRILMTGSSGFVGQHLRPRLLAAGHDVLALRRGTAAAPHERAGPAELAEVGSWSAWPAGVDAVLHLGAANPAAGDATSEADLRRANVEGTSALARRAAEEGVTRFVFVSSANVHGPRADGGLVGADDPLAPTSPYARSKAEAEAALREALEGTATHWTILRPAPVFGQGGRGSVASLAKLAARPFPLPLRGFGGQRSLIAVEDLAAALLAALEAPGARDRALLISGGAARPDEIVAALRAGAGRSPGILPAPVPVLSAVAALTGRGEKLKTLRRDFVLDAGPAEAALGWAPQQTLAARLAAFGKSLRT